MSAPAYLAAALLDEILVGWAALFGFGCVILTLLALAAWLDRRENRRQREPFGPTDLRRPTPTELDRLRYEVAELTRHAAAAIEAAGRARVAVDHARTHSVAREQARELAWHEYDTAQHAYLTALRAAPPVSVPTPAAVSPVPTGALPVIAGAAPTTDTEPGRRDFAHAAFSAYRRGELTVEQLREILRRAAGWDPRTERQEHELARWRQAEREARRRYDGAVAAERRAHREVDVAFAAASAWAAEAAAAVEDARNAQDFARHRAARYSSRRDR